MRWKNARLVITAINHRSAFATRAPNAPIGTASAHRRTTRRSVRKSASRSWAGSSASRTLATTGLEVDTEGMVLMARTAIVSHYDMNSSTLVETGASIAQLGGMPRQSDPVTQA